MNERSAVASDSNELGYSRWQLALKRLFDLIVALILLVCISPIWLFIVLWIRFDLPGPAIFTQTRVGLRGKPYTIYKFRTMIQNADALLKEKLVNGRGELTLGETLAFDLEYVRRWSFWLDLSILWKAFSVVFSGIGAYYTYQMLK